jgi:hypothetical protein
MTGDIAAGRILVRTGTPQLASFRQSKSSQIWSVMETAGPVFNAEVLAAGMTFFFMAGTISTTAFGFDRGKTLASAVDRLTRLATAEQCNSLEISGVTYESCLGVPFVRVSAHVRHLQVGSFFRSNGAV